MRRCDRAATRRFRQQDVRHGPGPGRCPWASDVTEAGAVVLPAGPSFYSHPEDRTALLDTVVARVLDQLGVDNSLMVRWEGELQNAHSRRSQPKEEV